VERYEESVDGQLQSAALQQATIGVGQLRASVILSDDLVISVLISDELKGLSYCCVLLLDVGWGGYRTFKIL
jgi:hypothetical protein